MNLVRRTPKWPRRLGRGVLVLAVVVVVLVPAWGCNGDDSPSPPETVVTVLPPGTEGAEASEYLLDRLLEFEKKVDKGEIEVAWSQEDLGWESLPAPKTYIRELQLQVARPPILLQLAGSRPQAEIWKLRDRILSWPEVLRARPFREELTLPDSEEEPRLALGVWVKDFADADAVAGRIEPLLGPDDAMERIDVRANQETVAEMLGYLESVSRARPQPGSTPSTTGSGGSVPSTSGGVGIPVPSTP